MDKFLGNLIAGSFLLTVLFLVLKIAGIITWAWVWVFSPVLVMLTILAFLVIYLAFKCEV